MPNQPYQDPILKKYGDLIVQYNKEIKRVYFGDPIRVGASELPCLILAKVDTRVANFTNVEDRHSVRISITLVTDVRDSISEDKTMVRGVNSLYDLMEGRNADYSLKANSILGIVRHNVELDVGNNLRTDLSSVTSVDYGMTVGKRKESGWSIEGMLELTATFTQVR